MCEAGGGLPPPGPQAPPGGHSILLSYLSCHPKSRGSTPILWVTGAISCHRLGGGGGGWGGGAAALRLRHLQCELSAKLCGNTVF